MKYADKRLARELQFLVREELGILPKLSLCQRLVRQNLPKPGQSAEEYVCHLFATYEFDLVESANQKLKELEREYAIVSGAV